MEAQLISTFQALAVAAFALLPGASYLFAYERVAGAFGVGFADRFVRFLAASAVFAAILSGPGFALYRRWIASGRLALGDVNTFHLELVALAYVVVPTVVGSVLGFGAKRKWSWLRPFIGESPEPRAWDFVWSPGTTAVLRFRLKSGTWLAGVFGTNENGRRSYASGYPEPQDIFVSTQLQADPRTGEFRVDGDDHPMPVDGGSGLLLRWDEIEYLEVQEF